MQEICKLDNSFLQESNSKEDYVKIWGIEPLEELVSITNQKI